MSIVSRTFGMLTPDQPVTQYTLTNQKRASVSILDYGGIVTNMMIPDRAGAFGDVCLGFDELDPYAHHRCGCMGMLIGRYANRIANGRFSLDGKVYQLDVNRGGHHLHGGTAAFGTRMWQACAESGEGGDRLVLTLDSPDGEGNYPGNLRVKVTYTFDDQCSLMIHYQAETDQPTILNMTNHSYFNLAGHDSGSICAQTLQIDADAITQVRQGLLPTGNFMPVAGTAFDMRQPIRLGAGLARMEQEPQMMLARGYDHNYVLRKGCAFGLAARMTDPASGRVMEVLTDQPGVQLYSACTTDFVGKGNARYGHFSAVCLETQRFPDSPNQPHFPTARIDPETGYDTTTIYAFSTEG